MPTPQPQRHTAEYVSLRDYIDMRLENVEKTIIAAQVAALSAYPDRGEFSKFKEQIEADARFLRESRAMLEGKASAESVYELKSGATLNRVITVFSIFLAIISIVLRFIGL